MADANKNAAVQSVRLTIELRVVDPDDNTELALRRAEVDVGVPASFDATDPRVFTVPVRIGTLDACVVIDGNYPGGSLTGVVRNRWKLGRTSSAIESSSFGVSLGGERAHGGGVTFALGERQARAELNVSAVGGPAGIPLAATVPRDAEDPCFAALQPRAILSIDDL